MSLQFHVLSAHSSTTVHLHKMQTRTVIKCITLTHTGIMQSEKQEDSKERQQSNEGGRIVNRRK